jgi:hypothetical protein
MRPGWTLDHKDPCRRHHLGVLFCIICIVPLWESVLPSVGNILLPLCGKLSCPSLGDCPALLWETLSCPSGRLSCPSVGDCPALLWETLSCLSGRLSCPSVGNCPALSLGDCPALSGRPSCPLWETVLPLSGRLPPRPPLSGRLSCLCLGDCPALLWDTALPLSEKLFWPLWETLSRAPLRSLSCPTGGSLPRPFARGCKSGQAGWGMAKVLEEAKV